MAELIIIGAGGYGRELLGYAQDIIKQSNNDHWKIAGFLDDNENALNGYELEYTVIGNIKDHRVSEKYVYICAIGDPKLKLKICREMEEKGAKFINLIHPSARVGETCQLGKGVSICPNAVLTENVSVGNFVAINCHSNCGHDSIIGDGCTLSVFCDVTGFANLGEGVFMGSHSSICPGITVGEYTKIGAGAIVINDLPTNCTAVGVPAKVIKYDYIED